MADDDQMVVWLRAAMDTAEKAAHAAPADPITSMARKFEVDSLRLKAELEQGKSDRIPYDQGQRDALHWASVVLPERMRPLSLHDPAAVLRRIAADRKTLDEHAENPYDLGYCRTCTEHEDGWAVPVAAGHPCATIRNLAEAWGWTEETT